jgi:S1-C subfamily serine protease
MRIIRVTCFCILLTTLGCSTTNPRGKVASAPVPAPLTNTDPFIATISVMQRSVFPVVCLTLGQNNTASLNSVEGTGFFVAQDGVFITAGHVINGIVGPRQRPAQPCLTSAIYLPANGWQGADIRWFKFVPGECAIVSDFDIARCRTIERINVPFTPVRFEDGEQPVGTSVAFTGFPLQNPTPVTARGYVAVYTSQDARLGRLDLVIDRATWPGASGSPVYLADGRVIGILLKRGTGEGAGITFARPSRFIRELVRDLQENQ